MVRTSWSTRLASSPTAWFRRRSQPGRPSAASPIAVEEGVDVLLHTSSGFNQVVLHIEDLRQLLV